MSIVKTADHNRWGQGAFWSPSIGEPLEASNNCNDNHILFQNTPIIYKTTKINILIIVALIKYILFHHENARS